MRHISKIILFAAALGVSACTNNDHLFGSNTPTDNSTGVGSGNASDPTTIAYFQQSIGDRILFPVDQSTLTAEAQVTVAAQADWLKQNPEFTAIVEGHADEQGTRDYNLGLGVRRANAVHEYLISRGVEAGRLRAVSFGKERPLEICSQEACYEKNRRAVTVLTAGVASS